MWTRDVTGKPLPGGHFFPEQNPDDTVAALEAFLRQ
jgi:haloacetate dehalogenase